MPIYAYKCSACGHAEDTLQKMSDAPLTICPACGAATYSKQVTAAGFQLKGSGWYVTDFRNGSGAAASAKSDNGAAEKGGDAKPSTDAKPAAAEKAPASSGGADSAGKGGAAGAGAAAAPASGGASSGSSSTASSS
jgi:putative FmdB family regulatory protein